MIEDSSDNIKKPTKFYLYYFGLSLILTCITSISFFLLKNIIFTEIIFIILSMFSCYLCVFILGHKILLAPYKELAETQHTLLEHKEKLKAVLNTIVDGLITTDEKGYIQDVNPAAAKMFGYQDHELIGKRVTMLSPDDAVVLNRNIDNKIKELTGVKKNGERFPMEVGLNSMLFEDHIIFVGIVRDISERKMADQALSNYAHDMEEMNQALSIARMESESANKIKSEFIASMSHEIRTPMNGIMGMTELLMASDLNDSQTRYAQAIMQCAESLLTIINDVLDFSKIEAGKLVLEEIPFNLRTICEELTEILSIKCLEKSIDIYLDYKQHIPSNLIGDPTRVRQIILNLLTNAIKFTNSGYVLLRVEELESDNISKDWAPLKISIVDTGIGIDEESKKSLFGKFIQADSSITRKFGGTGLGLAICKELAEKMQGSVGFESTLNVGSTFWFTASLKRNNNVNLRADFIPNIQDKHILLLIPNDINRQILSEIIMGFNCIPHPCHDITSAIGEINITTAKGESIPTAIIDYSIYNSIERLKEYQIQNFAICYPFPKIIDRDNLTQVGYLGFISVPYRHDAVYWELLKFNKDSKDIIDIPKSQSINSSTVSLGINQNTLAKLQGKRILLVEDNLVNAEISKAFLEKINIIVTIATNGIEAIDLFSTEKFDLILMDVQMPIMSGYDAASKIRELESSKNFKPIPIIALTANLLTATDSNFSETCINDFLIKPYKHDDLYNILLKWLIKTT